jgi:hypothetical protein
MSLRVAVSAVAFAVGQTSETAGMPSWPEVQRGSELEIIPRRSGTSKRGSNLGPLAPEYHTKRRYNTQNKPKRYNSLVHRLLVRDQGVGGSNPLSPTI